MINEIGTDLEGEKTVLLIHEYSKTSIICKLGNISDITGPKYEDLVQHMTNYNFDPNSPILKKGKQNIKKKNIFFTYFRSN